MHSFFALIVNRPEDVVTRRQLAGMHQKASSSHQGGASSRRLEHDTIRGLFDFEVAPGMQAEAVPYWFWQEHTASLIDLQSHALSISQTGKRTLVWDRFYWGWLLQLAKCLG
jgi:hypothetical protein